MEAAGLVLLLDDREECGDEALAADREEVVEEEPDDNEAVAIAVDNEPDEEADGESVTLGVEQAAVMALEVAVVEVVAAEVVVVVVGGATLGGADGVGVGVVTVAVVGVVADAAGAD